MKSEWVIQTKGLSIGYATNRSIISKLDLNIAKNGLIGLIGRNGTGKSTLIKTLAGLVAPLKGQIIINGQESCEYSQKQFAKQLSVLMSRQFIPGFTSVYDVISLGRHPYTNYFGKLKEPDRALIDRIISIMEIDHLKGKMAVSISDGEKQKVMLARALVQDTPILLLDEPTTYLDLPSKLKFFEHLKRVHDQMDKTILIASHEWHLLSDYCTDFVVFENEQVTQQKSIFNLLDRYDTPSKDYKKS